MIGGLGPIASLPHLALHHRVAGHAHGALNIPHPQAYNVPRSAKNVGYGGSYTGSVAAYMRLRYPHTFHAVLASSSVVKFLVGTEAWDRSKDWSSISIGNSIAEVASKTCQQKVAAGLAVLQGPLGQTKEGRALIASAAGCASLEQHVHRGGLGVRCMRLYERAGVCLICSPAHLHPLPYHWAELPWCPAEYAPAPRLTDGHSSPRTSFVSLGKHSGTHSR